MSTVQLDQHAVLARAGELGRLLHGCVHAGASIGFVLPFSHAEAEAWWTDVVAPRVADGHRVLLVAEPESLVTGAVQLDLDTPPNQPHRAGVTKLLVDPAVRRQDLARTLMHGLHEEAARRGRTLLTCTGCSRRDVHPAVGLVSSLSGS